MSRNIAHTVLIIIQLERNIMSFGFVSDEERKKRREQFDSNREKLGFGANAPQGSLLGAGKLGQQAQLGIGSTKTPTPAQVSPQIATNLASKQREQNLAQQQQARLQQRATRETEALAARQAAQKVIGLPAAQQPKAVEQFKAQAPAPQRSSYQPSKAGDVAIGGVQASTYLPQVMFAGTNALTGGKLSDLAKSGGIHPQNFRDALERFKTPQQVEAGVPQADKPAPNLGMMNNPNTSKSVNVDDGMIAKEARASQGIQEDGASALNPVYNEGVTRGNSGKGFGLSVDNNPAVAKPLAPAMGGGNSGFGFRVMPPPRKAYGEDSRRQALAMDIKPYKNGMGLTTGQIALKNSILNGDDAKYANEQYQGQLSTAQKLAQEAMSQSGENSRAELNERGANSRASQQLGFDAAKFQQTAAQAQQENDFNTRRLDMQQTNDDVTNHMPKQLNALYDKYAAAETEEQKSAVAAQIQMLKGSNADSDKEYWTSIGGGESLSEDGLTSTKNPDVLLNRNTGETRSIPLEPIDYANDPRALAIKNNTSLSNEERRKQLEALR